jgi:exodeoxyribonuclease VII large subunit
VLTGIGHTTNISVVDEVAYADRITPTDAADFLIEKTHNFEELLEAIGLRVQEAYLDTVITEQTKLQQATGHLKIYISQKLQDEVYYLSGSAEQLRNLTTRMVRESELTLASKANEINHIVRQVFSLEKERFLNYSKAISSTPLKAIAFAGLKLNQLESSANHLNPENILKRGFSITQINGKAIRNSNNLKTGDLIKTTFYEGYIESEVKIK